MLYDLKHNPASRRILTNIYNHQDLSEMALYPCAYSMTFNEEVPEEPKTTGNPELDQMVSEGQGALEEMRRLNDSIQDAAISAQIERLSQVSDKIFQAGAEGSHSAAPDPQVHELLSAHHPEAAAGL